MAGSDEWETPPQLYEALDREFHFEVDAAANATNTKCGPFLDDALNQEWSARSIWCNPPYSRLYEFTERALTMADMHRNTIVMLVPAYTDTRWWWNHVVDGARDVIFLKGRVKFYESGRPGRHSARFPSAVVVYRPRLNLPVAVQPTGPDVFWWDWRAGRE